MRYFLSYSRADAEDLAVDLANRLTAGPPSFPVWLDQCDLRPGEDWDDQIVEAIRACRVLLFVMTEDSVESDSGCKDEWVRALKYKKTIIPLRFHPEAGLPYRLGSRQFIDFTTSFDIGLARLRSQLVWMDTPEGVLQALKQRLQDAARELPRAADADRARVQQEIKELRRQINEQQRLLTNPQSAVEETGERIVSGMEREREPEHQVAEHRVKFINPPPTVAPTWFQDRHVETGQIVDFLRDDGLRMLTVVGRGGVGKTAMVCRLLKALEAGRLPDDPGSHTVDGIVYLSPVGAHQVSYPNLFADLCRLLPKDTAQRLERLYQDPRQSTKDQMLALLEAFPTGQIVVLLDNLEDVIDAKTLTLTDAGLDEALRVLLTAPHHTVKVILTTRVPHQLLLIQPAHQRHLDLDEGLKSPYAENILRAMDSDGALGLKTAPDALLADARKRTRGFPRALEALVAILGADHNTSLPEVLAEAGKLLPENVVEVLVGEAFNRLDPLAQQVMQALAIYGSPVPPVAVDYLLQPYLVAIDSRPVLRRLVNMQFVRRDAGRFYLHQVDREYALSRIPEGQPADRNAIDPHFTRYALLHRAADYFEQTRTPRESWRQLDDLTAQLAEFELRYRGGDYDAAASVLLGVDFDYLLLWGHYRLVSKLHARLYGKLTDPGLESSSIGNLGTALSWMGKNQEAIQCYNEALVLARIRESREDEGIWLGNLGGCYASLGEVRRAIEYHEQALTIAREIGDRQGEAAGLGSLGGCYASLGELRRAIEHHEQALAIFREIGDRRGEAAELNNLGLCYYSLGELRRAIEHHEQALAIAREIGDRRGEAAGLGSLGPCYYSLGELRRAIEHHEQALAIAREIGDRQGEAADLGSLGPCYYSLGELRRAIEHHGQALAIFREIGDRQGEAADLGNLSGCYYSLGELRRAIEHHEQALAIYREIGDRRGEATELGNLGLCYADLGELRRAIEHHEQALAIAREIGYRQGEAADLGNLGGCYADQGEWGQAVVSYQEAIRIADEISATSLQNTLRCSLSETYLFTDDLSAAREAAEAARRHDSPSDNMKVFTLLGIVLLRQGEAERASLAFTDALVHANILLAHTADNYSALDSKALALCGLGLVEEDSARLTEAAVVFHDARARTRAAGITQRVLRLFDALAAADRSGALNTIRAAASVTAG